jgi:Flavodoxins
MRSLVVCESLFGNTEAVAVAIAEGLSHYGESGVLSPNAADLAEVENVDLLVVGAPTHAWGMPRQRSVTSGKHRGSFEAGPLLREWFDGLTDGNGRPAVAFATRMDKPLALTGSAAGGIARRLRKHGWSRVAAPESFLVVGTEGPLCEGEVERARAWGDALGAVAVGSAHVRVS